MIVSVIPVTIQSKRDENSQIRLRNHLGDETLIMLMKIGIEGPKTLKDELLDMIIDLWKKIIALFIMGKLGGGGKLHTGDAIIG